jgi:hypothetical protein
MVGRHAAGALVPASTSTLDRLAALAKDAGAGAIAADADRLARRLAEGRFYVACVGQFKRGKSTLLNALVGRSVLPTGVAPVTSVVTVLRHGSELAARVRTSDGLWLPIDPAGLADYVAEAGNPENTKRVDLVEVFVPSPLLGYGLCLVDTPGIGSTLAGNTAVTRAFVPHIDAALVVLGGDPPVANEELALIGELAPRVEAMLVVLNKADRLSDPERAEARAFTDRVLRERLGDHTPEILEISAAEQFSTSAPRRDWSRLVTALATLAREAGSAIVDSAERRGTEALAHRLVREIDEHREALTRPIDESEHRIEALKKCAAEAERSLEDLGALLGVEQRRLAQTFARHRDAFLARAVPAARAELSAALATAGMPRGNALRRHAFSLAQDIYRHWVDRWRAEEQPAAERAYRDATERFVSMANVFLERLAASGDSALAAAMPRTLDPEIGFRTKGRLHYTEILSLTARSPLDWLGDLIRSRPAAVRALQQRAGAYLEHLLTTNAARVANDLDDRVLESRRRLESEVRARLRAVSESADRALHAARVEQEAGAPAVRAALARLDHLRGEVRSLAPTTAREH